MKSIRGTLAAAAFSALWLTSAAFADDLTIQGSATGTFTSKVSGLTFQGKDPFSVTTIGGNGIVDLGSFTYVAPVIALDSTVFKSTIKITAPEFTIPGSVYPEASVDAVALFGVGGATINFSNAPISFSFANALGSGSFDLRLKDVFVVDSSLRGGSSPAALRGEISNAAFIPVAVTEPPPVEALLTLLAGVAYALKNRMATAG